MGSILFSRCSHSADEGISFHRVHVQGQIAREWFAAYELSACEAWEILMPKAYLAGFPLVGRQLLLPLAVAPRRIGCWRATSNRTTHRGKAQDKARPQQQKSKQNRTERTSKQTNTSLLKALE